MATSAGSLMPSIADCCTNFGRLLASLGIPFAESETLYETRAEVASYKTAALAYCSVEAFCSALGACQRDLANAMTARVAVDGVELQWDWMQTPQMAWTSLCKHVRDISEVQVVFALSKTKLVEQHLPMPEGKRTVLFVQSQNLIACLHGLLASPHDFERVFWGSSDKAPPTSLPFLNIVVLDRSGASTGSHAAILGKDHVAPALTPIDALFDAAMPVPAFYKARETLHWERRWFRELTPSHLRFPVADRNQGHVDILNALDAHAANTAILYLAPRSRQMGNAILARFATDHHQFDIQLYAQGSELPNLEGERVGKLLDLLEFAYQTDRVNDRISFAQAAMCAVVAPREGGHVPAREVMRHGTRLLETTEWTWRSFLEERISKYQEDTKGVEEDVQTACEQFDTVTSKLIEDMARMILSSIGAFIAAFIAAGLKKETSVMAFQVVLAGYVVYLVIIAGWMSSRFVYDRFQSARHSYSIRRERHEVVLGEERVKDLIGTSIQSCERRFWKWFGVSNAICGLFVIGLVMVIWYAPYLF